MDSPTPEFLKNSLRVSAINIHKISALHTK